MRYKKMSGFLTLLEIKKLVNKIEVASIQSVIARPYAAPMLEEFLKYKVIPQHPANNKVLMPGIYNCPLASVGSLIFILGHKFKRILSLMSV